MPKSKSTGIPAYEKEKYMQIMNTQGLAKALTQLHHDMWKMEFDSFEGPHGYQPEKWERIKAYRDFSRELWGYNWSQEKRENGS